MQPECATSTLAGRHDPSQTLVRITGSEPERHDFWEICEDRYEVRSTILTSQLPVSRWHEQIGDPTLADGILDRLVHNAHRIEMRGDSMRKNRPKGNSHG
jgi:DNA replication protein DnaC